MKRRLILALLLAPLGGCGLQPLYGGGSAGPVASLLGSVQVGPIEGQPGWLMRTKLIDRLGEGAASAPRYRLDVKLNDNLTLYGLRADRAATQERRTLRARYQLVEIASGTTLLDATAGSDVSIDTVSSEYATVAAEQTALENLSGIIADQIVARIAIYANRTARK